MERIEKEEDVKERRKLTRINEQICRRTKRLLDIGISARNIKRALQVPYSFVRRIQSETHEAVDTLASRFRRRKDPETKAQEEEAVKRTVQDIVKANCTLTLHGISEALQSTGIKRDPATIHRYLAQLHYTKKKLKRVPIERNTAEKLVYRQQYCQMISQIPEANLVFMDETGFSQHTALSFGWAPRGEEPFIHIAAHRKQIVSLVAAVSLRGFEATRLVRGPVTNQHICEFLQHNLDHLEQTEILVMDNARVHHAASVKQKIVQLHRPVRYLPAYTPQLNPIEYIFAEIKAQFVRRRLNRELTILEIQTLIQDSIRGMKTKSFDRYFHHYQQWVQKGLAGQMFI